MNTVSRLLAMKTPIWVLSGVMGVACSQGLPGGESDTRGVEAPRLEIQLGHSGSIVSVAFSPDGKILASGSMDHTIKLWSVADGAEVRTLVGHSDTVMSVAYSPHGEMLASGGQDGAIKLWDLLKGKELRTLDARPGSVFSVAFSPDGRTLASGSGNHTVSLWDVATGKLLRTLTGHQWLVRDIAFSPDGKTLVSIDDDGAVKFWDPATGKELSQWSGIARSVVFSPDGRLIAFGTWRGDVELVDVASATVLRKMTHSKDKHDVWGVAFSPTGEFLASGCQDGTIKIWNVSDGTNVRTLTGHSASVNSIAISPDGKRLASGSEDRTIKLWSIGDGVEQRTLGGHSAIVNAIALSSDGNTLAVGSQAKDIKLWDLLNGKPPRTLSGHSINVASVVFSPDAKILASSGDDYKVNLWDVGIGEVLRTLSIVPFMAGNTPQGSPEQPILEYTADGKMLTPSGVNTLAFSENGKLLVSAGLAVGSLELWDPASGMELGYFGDGFTAPSRVRSAAFSPDGKTLASAGLLHTTLWDVSTRRKLRALDDKGVSANTVAFSPAGRILASDDGNDGTIKLWDENGQALRVLRGHTDFVNSVSFSPDGHTLASGSDDHSINLWGTERGELIRSLNGHLGPVSAVSFSPDGKALASGSVDTTVKIWRTSDGVLQATLISFNDGSWVVADADGRFDTSDLEHIQYLRWVMPGDPLAPLPLEIFMRDYYEPRLLSRIMNGEKFKAVRPLGSLNRVQPTIKITDARMMPNQPEWVNVSVEASGMSRTYESAKLPVKTGVHDLRLLRNGQLVGYADGSLADFGKAPYRRTFRVRLPTGNARVRFTAYVFNDAQVKSETAELYYTPPVSVRGNKPRAYVITVGVDHHDNTAWNLHYAGNDARAMSESVLEKLRALDRYDEVVPVILTSDEQSSLASKANFRAVLERLAGHPANVGAIPNSDRLQPATPDDFVLVSFSGHGVDSAGDFYLIPSDTGPGEGRAVTPELLAHAISSDELTSLFRDVDAGDIALIIDACQSAASVGSEFKPGPMGARGLGQLAYEKGMLILAASQAEENAQESMLTQHGLLTYALVNDGLDQGKADYKPRDNKITLEEWLSYGVLRVPSLAEEVARGTLKAPGDSMSKGTRLLATDYRRNHSLQQPALFDFTKGRREATIAAAIRSP